RQRRPALEDVADTLLRVRHEVIGDAGGVPAGRLSVPPQLQHVVPGRIGEAREDSEPHRSALPHDGLGGRELLRVGAGDEHVTGRQPAVGWRIELRAAVVPPDREYDDAGTLLEPELAQRLSANRAVHGDL